MLTALLLVCCFKGGKKSSLNYAENVCYNISALQNMLLLVHTHKTSHMAMKILHHMKHGT